MTEIVLGGCCLPPVLLPRTSQFPAAMPNRQKQIIFSVSGVLGFFCALTAAVATGLPFWLSGTVLCRTGAELVNATGAELDKFLGELSYGLFHGVRVKQCGLGGRASRFSREFFYSARARTPDTQLKTRSGGSTLPVQVRSVISVDVSCTINNSVVSSQNI